MATEAMHIQWLWRWKHMPLHAHANCATAFAATSAANTRLSGGHVVRQVAT